MNQRYGVGVGLERVVKHWSVALALAVFIGSPLVAQARALNLGGSLQLTYSTTMTDSESSENKITTFGQRYSLGAFGDLLRIGSYRADVSWFDERLETRSEFGTTTTEQERRLNILDYRLSMNLFPTQSPLSLTAQQINRKNEVGITTEETVKVFGASWVVHLRRLPRFVLSYQRSGLEAETEGTAGREFETQAATVQAEQTIGSTRIMAGYQVQETEVEETGSSRSQGLNLNVNSQLTTSLLLAGAARYTTTRTPANVVAPGVNIFQERSAGLTAIYRPPRFWWDGNLGYNYSESPFFEDFKSHRVQGNLNARPTDRIDTNTNLRYMRFTISDRLVNTEGADASVNWRPLFGLSTGAGASASLTSISDDIETDTLTQNYRYNINQVQRWRFLQYQTAYNVSYGLSSTSPEGADSTDLANSISLGLDNANIEVVHVGMNASLTNIQRTTDSDKSDQTTYNVGLNADSSYFRSLILRGDSLTLRAASNYSDTRGIGIEGRILTFETTADYVWRLILANTGYRIEDYPDAILLDRQRFFGQVQWVMFPLRNLSLNAGVKDTFEDNRFRNDLNRFEGNAQVTYQLGALTLSLQYQRIVTRVIGVAESQVTSDVIFVRAFRPF